MLELRSTVNPDGSRMEHLGGFDPRRKAIAVGDIFKIPVTNTVKKGGVCHSEKSLIEQAKQLTNGNTRRNARSHERGTEG